MCVVGKRRQLGSRVYSLDWLGDPARSVVLLMRRTGPELPLQSDQANARSLAGYDLQRELNEALRLQVPDQIIP